MTDDDIDAPGTRGEADALAEACSSLAALVDEVAAREGLDPLSLRSRLGAILSPPASTGVDDASCMFAGAVIAATGPCKVDRAGKVLGLAAAVALSGSGHSDPQLLQRAVARGNLMQWRAAAAPGSVNMVETRPGREVAVLRPGAADMIRMVASLKGAEFDRVCGAATRSREYAISLLADPARAIPQARKVPEIPF